MPPRFQQAFPAFFQSLVEHNGAEIEEVLPPATEAKIAEIERRCGVPLPDSYKRLLRCAPGFWLLGGRIQFGPRHPFFHRFPPLTELTPQQRQVIARKGGGWPPPSQGMLCFAEISWRPTATRCCGMFRTGCRMPSIRFTITPMRLARPRFAGCPIVSRPGLESFFATKTFCLNDGCESKLSNRVQLNG